MKNIVSFTLLLLLLAVCANAATVKQPIETARASAK